MGCAPASQDLQIQDREKEQEQKAEVGEQILKGAYAWDVTLQHRWVHLWAYQPDCSK